MQKIARAECKIFKGKIVMRIHENRENFSPHKFLANMVVVLCYE